jgi:hypothetical protein
MLLEAWGAKVVLGISADGSTAGLVAIELPWPLRVRSPSSSSNAPPAVRVAVNGVWSGEGRDGEGEKGPTAEDAAALNLLLRKKYSIEVPVACVSGMLFARISAQIYNSMPDYVRLKDVVLSLRPGV